MAKLSTTSVFGDLLVDGMIHGNVTGNLTGNASTATSATTATSAGKWTTARTITIGSKGKSVDGSANVSWSLAEIGAAAASHTHTIANITDLRIKNGATTGITIADPYQTWAHDNVKNNDIIFGGSYNGHTTTDANIVFASGNGKINMVIDGEYYAAEGKQRVYHTGYKPSPSDIGAAASSHGTHVTYSTTAPLVAGTAAVGSANNVSRGDHVHPAQTSVSGNAGTATKLATARTLTIGSKGKTFDGSANVSWSLSEIGAKAAEPTTFGLQTNYVSVRTAGRTAAQYYEFWDSGDAGWAGIKAGAIYDNNNRVYSASNKPTLSDLGAAASSHGTHVTWSTTAPKVAGTAAVGSETKVARGDHVHAAQTSVSGNAGTATKLATARTLTIGSTGKTFDGSGNVSWTLAEIGAAASSHSHTSISYQDTRAVNTAAKDVPAGLSIHLKSNGTDGISDGGSYHPVLMMKPWGDKSGWPVGQLAVTQNNNLYFRVSSGADDTSWNAWKKVSLDGHTHSAGGTVTAVNSNLSSVTINSYDSILSGINTNIGKL